MRFILNLKFKFKRNFKCCACR